MMRSRLCHEHGAAGNDRRDRRCYDENASLDRERGHGLARRIVADAVGRRANEKDHGQTGRANIGNRLLARFAAIALDYERRILTLEPDE